MGYIFIDFSTKLPGFVVNVIACSSEQMTINDPSFGPAFLDMPNILAENTNLTIRYTIWSVDGRC